jgi:hypothetical protein
VKTLLPVGHGRQLNGASASIALAPIPREARFTPHGKRRGVGVGEADIEMECQADVAVRGRVLANQKLAESRKRVVLCAAAHSGGLGIASRGLGVEDSTASQKVL